jgi:hypothetical protein
MAAPEWEMMLEIRKRTGTEPLFPTPKGVGFLVLKSKSPFNITA